MFKGLPGLTPHPGSGLTECSCVDAEKLSSEVERLKQQLTSCSSFIPTGNLTMPWGKPGYSHCQYPFSWTELIKVLSFIRYYPILSPFLVFHTSCFIDNSDLYPILSLSSHCTFFCCIWCVSLDPLYPGVQRAWNYIQVWRSRSSFAWKFVYFWARGSTLAQTRARSCPLAWRTWLAFWGIA